MEFVGGCTDSLGMLTPDDKTKAGAKGEGTERAERSKRDGKDGARYRGSGSDSDKESLIVVEAERAPGGQAGTRSKTS